MKILSNAFFTIDTHLVSGRPLNEVHTACYVYKDKIKVDIIRNVDLVTKTDRYTCKMSGNRKYILVLNDLEKFCDTIEAMGYQLGNHDNERVTLTESGEIEASLLSSIPYLFTETLNLGEQ